MKSTKLVSLLLALILGACHQEKTPQTDSSTNLNKAIARAAFEAFNKHDWLKMSSYYTNNALFLDPQYGTGYVRKTQKEITASHQKLEKFSPDVKDSLTTVIASGDKVVVEFTSSGTTTDKKHWQLPLCSVLTIKDGKIVKDATYYDND